MANVPTTSPVPHASAPSRDACTPDDHDPRIARLMNHLIGRVAAKWTILVLETLEHRGQLRFHELQRALPGVSQKVLTSVLRQMERDGLVVRTVHPEIPPRVDYALTTMGATLGQAFCGVWLWAKQHLVAVEAARDAFDRRASSDAD
ncbi:MAG TPA: helix-turn-helix domain-containing protein [Dyella sp.]|nr:helix-turn-helix domain-containing protein [Dyella sp.]